MGDRFSINWIDSGREPQCEPDPKFPNGKNLSLRGGATTSCIVSLPYPAKRCGAYIVECNECSVRVAVTTAGRPDDPRSVEIACKRHKERDGHRDPVQ